MKKWICFLSMAVTMMFLFGCVGCGETGKTVKESIMLSQNSLTIMENEQVSLIAITSPYEMNVLWESSDEKVALVSSSGNVTGLSAGKATVTAKTLSGEASAVCQVTVVKAEIKESIKLSQSTLTIKENEQAILIASVTPADAAVNWSSSNEKVALVSSSGSVTGLSAGKSTITATTVSGKVSAACLVTVEVSLSITLSQTELEMFVGDSYQLSALVSPSDINVKVTWSSSNTSVATVQNGSVKALSAGTAFIQAEVDKTSAVCTVNVKENPLKAAYNAVCAQYSSGSYVLSLASDSSYISADTNPMDLDDYFNMTYGNIIESLNIELGLPDYIWEEMLQTRAIDGRQKETFGNIEVSWSYHPDQGLEVLYKLKNTK